MNSLFIGLILGYIILWSKLALDDTFNLVKTTDFTAFYTAAKILLSSSRHLLYDLDTQAHTQQTLIYPIIFKDGLLPYNYPPFFVVMFLLLAYLPLGCAYLTWVSFNVFIMVMTLLILQRHLRDLFSQAGITIFLGAFSFFPFFAALIKGSTPVLALLILTGTFILLKRSADYLAGATLALGLYKPQLIILLLAIIVFKRRWKTFLGFGFVSGLLALISLVSVGWDGIMGYIKITILTATWHNQFGIYPERMSNLKGFFYSLFNDHHFSLVCVVISSLILLYLLILIWRGNWQPHLPNFDLQFALTLIITLLVSPHLNDHDLSLLILPGILIANYSLQGGQYGINQKFLIGMVLGGSLIPLINHFFYNIIPIQINVVLMVLLTGALTSEILSRTRLEGEKTLIK